MHVSTVKQLLNTPSLLDKTITTRGWVRTRRDSKAGISFLTVYDGSCFNSLQVVVPNTLENYESDVLKLTAGCSVVVSGKLVASQGKGQSYEMQAHHLEVIGFVDDPDTYPISKKHHTLEFLREVAHLRPRTNVMGAATRLRSSLAQALHRFFFDEGFYWLNTPIITASDCEGAGELFRVSTLDLLNLPKTDSGAVDFSKDFFEQETYLTVSGQLQAEAYACALSKVYTFGPTFRAENSNTSRHLAEFWMIEPEIAFADIHDTVALADAMLKFIFQFVLEHNADDMDFFKERIDPTCIDRLAHIINTKMEVMTYTDAVELLLKSGKQFDYPVTWGIDLQTEHERYICEEKVKGPVTLINYPRDIKPFYMRRNDDGKTVAAMDVLVPGVGELIGGSQREERLAELDARMQEHNMHHLGTYQWYRDLRRFGTVPHAGFGMGFERLVNYVTGLGNIRDVIPFPRTPGNAKF